MRIALVLLSLFTAASASAASKADLNAKTLDGHKVQLKDLRGKFVVLNFWATWCAPCKQEMPVLVKTAAQASKPGLVFLAVSIDEPGTQARVSDMVKKYGITFPVWTGANGDDVYRLSKGEAVPATLFIDRDGTILARVSGQIRENELKERIAWLTGDRTGARPKEFVSHIE